MLVGKITDRKVEKNKDSETDVLVLTVELTDTDDERTVQLFRQAGEDCNPPNDSTVLVFDAGGGWLVGAGVDDGQVPSVQPGERELYSLSGGSKQATIKLVSDGQLELNGTGDFAVRFKALQAAFDQLRDDFNNFLTATFAPHTHPVSGATAGPTTSIATPSTADISGSKIDTIEVPS